MASRHEVVCSSTDLDTSNQSENSIDAINKKNAVSFNIQVKSSCARQPPKRLLTKTTRKKSTTMEVLNEKQIQAEKRREVRKTTTKGETFR